jgi:hypothetical protein
MLKKYFPENVFEKNPYTSSPAKRDRRQLLKNLPKSHFSDVISIEGSQGHLQGVSPKKHLNYMPKKNAHRSPLNCTVK